MALRTIQRSNNNYYCFSINYIDSRGAKSMALRCLQEKRQVGQFQVSRDKEWKEKRERVEGDIMDSIPPPLYSILQCLLSFFFMSRLIEDMLANGKFSAPRFRHPLSPTISIPPTLFLGGILIALLVTRYGRIWWLGSLLTFTAISYLSAFIKP